MNIADNLLSIKATVEAILAAQTTPAPVVVDLSPVLSETAIIKADTAAIRAEVTPTLPTP